MNPTVSRLLVEFDRLSAAGYGHRYTAERSMGQWFGSYLVD
jgi:hypothetical protein